MNFKVTLENDIFSVLPYGIRIKLSKTQSTDVGDMLIINLA